MKVTEYNERVAKIRDCARQALETPQEIRAMLSKSGLPVDSLPPFLKQETIDRLTEIVDRAPIEIRRHLNFVLDAYQEMRGAWNDLRDAWRSARKAASIWDEDGRLRLCPPGRHERQPNRKDRLRQGRRSATRQASPQGRRQGRGRGVGFGFPGGR